MTRRIALALVCASYFVGMTATFPIKKVRIKPGMVQHHPKGARGSAIITAALDTADAGDDVV